MERISKNIQIDRLARPFLKLCCFVQRVCNIEILRETAFVGNWKFCRIDTISSPFLGRFKTIIDETPPYTMYCIYVCVCVCIYIYFRDTLSNSYRISFKTPTNRVLLNISMTYAFLTRFILFAHKKYKIYEYSISLHRSYLLYTRETIK